MTTTPEQAALDVWLRFDSPDDEETAYEANTYRDRDGYRIEWYHTAVGQVVTVRVPTRAAARAWYEENGYQDFTS